MMRELPITVEPSPRWVRVKFRGQIIADSRRAMLLIQYGPGRLPTYYFPLADVRPGLAAPVHPPGEFPELRGYVSFAWDEMDAWYEEEEEVFVHARDPHKRVDVLASSRQVRVVIGNETVADTRRPSLPFETSLPTRYYIPRDDVRMDLLEPTSLTTRCPYKGIARYWSVRNGQQVAKNVVWSYPDPIPECPKIRGLLCFFNERTDLYVDGELQPRPRTFWSEREPPPHSA